MCKILLVVCALILAINGFPQPRNDYPWDGPPQYRLRRDVDIQQNRPSGVIQPTEQQIQEAGPLRHNPEIFENHPIGGVPEGLVQPSAATDKENGESLDRAEFGWGWGWPRYRYYYYPRSYYYNYYPNYYWW